jgi:hypothetical protein
MCSEVESDKVVTEMHRGQNPEESGYGVTMKSIGAVIRSAAADALYATECSLTLLMSLGAPRNEIALQPARARTRRY